MSSVEEAENPGTSTSPEGFDVLHGARTSLRTNASAYAYSIFITSCFGIVNVAVGSPSVLRIFLFLGGATIAFALAETVVSRGFRDRFRPEPSDVVMLGSAMALFSVSVAALAAWGLAEATDAGAAWFLAPFGGTSTYIVLSAVEMAIARKKHEESPPKEEK